MDAPKGMLLLGGRGEDEEHRQRLVTSLFRQPRSLMVSSVGSLVAAGVCWAHTASEWYLVWGLASCAVLGLRLALALAFRDNRERWPPDAWAWMFFAGATATAAIAGIGASLTVLLSRDLVATLYMATNVISFAGGAAVRNNASPLASLSQTTIALGLPGVACLLSGQHYLQPFAVLMLLHLTAQFEITRALGQTTLWLMSSERRQAFLNAQLSRSCAQLEGANERLTQLSATDGLTGLANRRAFDAELMVRWNGGLRDQSPLSLLMIDADYFKRFNDQYGHLVGDDALRWMAQVLRATLHRPSDFVGRFGGEEFAVLLPDTDTAGAAATAQRLRQALAHAPLPAGMLAGGRLTVSVGIATIVPKPDEDGLMLVNRADRALYVAKDGGRDRVEVWRASEPVGDSRERSAM